MAKRELEEINAGSMADIAFLLLIFFLITTTMNLPQVQEERLPQKSDTEFLLNERNVLEILANSVDRVAVEGQWIDKSGESDYSKIKDAVKDFYDHPQGTQDQPIYDTISVEKCVEKIAKINPEDPMMGIWENRLEACKTLRNKGVSSSFILPQNATISIGLDNNTKYIIYMNVVDQIYQALHELKKDYCKNVLKINYDKLNDKNDEDKEIIKALREIYPKRIMKEKNRAVQ